MSQPSFITTDIDGRLHIACKHSVKRTRAARKWLVDCEELPPCGSMVVHGATALFDHGLAGSFVHALFVALAKHGVSLRTLEFRACELTPLDDSQVVAQLWCTPLAPRTLVVSNSAAPPGLFVVQVVSAVAHAHGVSGTRVLILNGNQLHAQVAPALALALSMPRLSLHNAAPAPDGQAAPLPAHAEHELGTSDAAEQWTVGCGVLRQLELVDNELGAEGARVLVEALPACDSLQRLELTRNGLTEEVGELLGRALASNTSLRRLCVSYEELGSAGTAALCSELKLNASLTELQLHASKLDSQAEVAARAMLACRAAAGKPLSLGQLGVSLTARSTPSDAMLRVIASRRGPVPLKTLASQPASSSRSRSNSSSVNASSSMHLQDVSNLARTMLRIWESVVHKQAPLWRRALRMAAQGSLRLDETLQLGVRPQRAEQVTRMLSTAEVYTPVLSEHGDSQRTSSDACAVSEEQRVIVNAAAQLRAVREEAVRIATQAAAAGAVDALYDMLALAWRWLALGMGGLALAPLTDHRPARHQTPLIAAVRSGSDAAVQLLLDFYIGGAAARHPAGTAEPGSFKQTSPGLPPAWHGSVGWADSGLATLDDCSTSAMFHAASCGHKDALAVLLRGWQLVRSLPPSVVQRASGALGNCCALHHSAARLEAQLLDHASVLRDAFQGALSYLDSGVQVDLACWLLQPHGGSRDSSTPIAEERAKPHQRKHSTDFMQLSADDVAQAWEHLPAGPGLDASELQFEVPISQPWRVKVNPQYLAWLSSQTADDEQMAAHQRALEAQAAALVRSTDQVNALMLACGTKPCPPLRLLHWMIDEAGADINAVTSAGDSALSFAFRAGNYEAVRLLLAYDQLEMFPSLPPITVPVILASACERTCRVRPVRLLPQASDARFHRVLSGMLDPEVLAEFWAAVLRTARMSVRARQARTVNRTRRVAALVSAVRAIQQQQRTAMAAGQQPQPPRAAGGDSGPSSALASSAAAVATTTTRQTGASSPLSPELAGPSNSRLSCPPPLVVEVDALAVRAYCTHGSRAESAAALQHMLDSGFSAGNLQAVSAAADGAYSALLRQLGHKQAAQDRPAQRPQHAVASRMESVYAVQVHLPCGTSDAAIAAACDRFHQRLARSQGQEQLSVHELLSRTPHRSIRTTKDAGKWLAEFSADAAARMVKLDSANSSMLPLPLAPFPAAVVDDLFHQGARVLHLSSISPGDLQRLRAEHGFKRWPSSAPPAPDLPAGPPGVLAHGLLPFLSDTQHAKRHTDGMKWVPFVRVAPFVNVRQLFLWLTGRPWCAEGAGSDEQQASDPLFNLSIPSTLVSVVDSLDECAAPLTAVARQLVQAVAHAAAAGRAWVVTDGSEGGADGYVARENAQSARPQPVIGMCATPEVVLQGRVPHAWLTAAPSSAKAKQHAMMQACTSAALGLEAEHSLFVFVDADHSALLQGAKLAATKAGHAVPKPRRRRHSSCESLHIHSLASPTRAAASQAAQVDWEQVLSEPPEQLVPTLRHLLGFSASHQERAQGIHDSQSSPVAAGGLPGPSPHDSDEHSSASSTGWAETSKAASEYLDLIEKTGVPLGLDDLAPGRAAARLLAPSGAESLGLAADCPALNAQAAVTSAFRQAFEAVLPLHAGVRFLIGGDLSDLTSLYLTPQLQQAAQHAVSATWPGADAGPASARIASAVDTSMGLMRASTDLMQRKASAMALNAMPTVRGASRVPTVLLGGREAQASGARAAMLPTLGAVLFDLGATHGGLPMQAALCPAAPMADSSSSSSSSSSALVDLRHVAAPMLCTQPVALQKAAVVLKRQSAAAFSQFATGAAVCELVRECMSNMREVCARGAVQRAVYKRKRQRVKPEVAMAIRPTSCQQGGLGSEHAGTLPDFGEIWLLPDEPVPPRLLEALWTQLVAEQPALVTPERPHRKSAFLKLAQLLHTAIIREVPLTWTDAMAQLLVAIRPLWGIARAIVECGGSSHGAQLAALLGSAWATAWPSHGDRLPVLHAAASNMGSLCNTSRLAMVSSDCVAMRPAQQAAAAAAASGHVVPIGDPFREQVLYQLRPSVNQPLSGGLGGAWLKLCALWDCDALIHDTLASRWKDNVFGMERPERVVLKDVLQFAWTEDDDELVQVLLRYGLAQDPLPFDALSRAVLDALADSAPLALAASQVNNSTVQLLHWYAAWCTDQSGGPPLGLAQAAVASQRYNQDVDLHSLLRHAWKGAHGGSPLIWDMPAWLRAAGQAMRVLRVVWACLSGKFKVARVLVFETTQPLRTCLLIVRILRHIATCSGVQRQSNSAVHDVRELLRQADEFEGLACSMFMAVHDTTHGLHWSAHERAAATMWLQCPAGLEWTIVDAGVQCMARTHGVHGWSPQCFQHDELPPRGHPRLVRSDLLHMAVAAHAKQFLGLEFVSAVTEALWQQGECLSGHAQQAYERLWLSTRRASELSDVRSYDEGGRRLVHQRLALLASQGDAVLVEHSTSEPTPLSPDAGKSPAARLLPGMSNSSLWLSADEEQALRQGEATRLQRMTSIRSKLRALPHVMAAVRYMQAKARVPVRRGAADALDSPAPLLATDAQRGSTVSTMDPKLYEFLSSHRLWPLAPALLRLGVQQPVDCFVITSADAAAVGIAPAQWRHLQHTLNELKSVNSAEARAAHQLWYEAAHSQRQQLDAMSSDTHSSWALRSYSSAHGLYDMLQDLGTSVAAGTGVSQAMGGGGFGVHPASRVAVTSAYMPDMNWGTLAQGSRLLVDKQRGLQVHTRHGAKDQAGVVLARALGMVPLESAAFASASMAASAAAACAIACTLQVGPAVLRILHSNARAMIVEAVLPRASAARSRAWQSDGGTDRSPAESTDSHHSGTSQVAAMKAFLSPTGSSPHSSQDKLEQRMCVVKTQPGWLPQLQWDDAACSAESPWTAGSCTTKHSSALRPAMVHASDSHSATYSHVAELVYEIAGWTRLIAWSLFQCAQAGDSADTPMSTQPELEGTGVSAESEHSTSAALAQHRLGTMAARLTGESTGTLLRALACDAAAAQQRLPAGLHSFLGIAVASAPSTSQGSAASSRFTVSSGMHGAPVQEWAGTGALAEQPTPQPGTTLGHPSYGVVQPALRLHHASPAASSLYETCETKAPLDQPGALAAATPAPAAQDLGHSEAAPLLRRSPEAMSSPDSSSADSAPPVARVVGVVLKKLPLGDLQQLLSLARTHASHQSRRQTGMQFAPANYHSMMTAAPSEAQASTKDTAAQWLAQGGWNSFTASVVALDVAEALAKLHDAGVIHGDVSARNVCCTLAQRHSARDQWASSKLVAAHLDDHLPLLHGHVVDLGLSVLVTPRLGTERDERGRVEQVGVPAHRTLSARSSAPETLAHGMISRASDVYCFGTLLAQLVLCGGDPWHGADDSLVRLRVSEGDQPTAMQWPDANEGLVQIMRACWKLDPAGRPTASKLVYVLREHLRSLCTGLATSAMETPQPEAMQLPGRAQPAAGLLSAASSPMLQGTGIAEEAEEPEESECSTDTDTGTLSSGHQISVSTAVTPALSVAAPHTSVVPGSLLLPPPAQANQAAYLLSQAANGTSAPTTPDQYTGMPSPVVELVASTWRDVLRPEEQAARLAKHGAQPDTALAERGASPAALHSPSVGAGGTDGSPLAQRATMPLLRAGSGESQSSPDQSALPSSETAPASSPDQLSSLAPKAAEHQPQRLAQPSPAAPARAVPRCCARLRPRSHVAPKHLALLVGMQDVMFVLLHSAVLLYRDSGTTAAAVGKLVLFWWACTSYVADFWHGNAARSLTVLRVTRWKHLLMLGAALFQFIAWGLNIPTFEELQGWAENASWICLILAGVLAYPLLLEYPATSSRIGPAIYTIVSGVASASKALAIFSATAALLLAACIIPVVSVFVYSKVGSSNAGDVLQLLWAPFGDWMHPIELRTKAGSASWLHMLGICMVAVFLTAVLLLVNLMVAVSTDSYTSAAERSKGAWKLYRLQQLWRFMNRSVVPAPLYLPLHKVNQLAHNSHTACRRCALALCGRMERGGPRAAGPARLKARCCMRSSAAAQADAYYVAAKLQYLQASQRQHKLPRDKRSCLSMSHRLLAAARLRTKLLQASTTRPRLVSPLDPLASGVYSVQTDALRQVQHVALVRLLRARQHAAVPGFASGGSTSKSHA